MNVSTIIATTNQITTRTHFLSPLATLSLPAALRTQCAIPCRP
jgi:hypothetical protein